MKRRVNPLNKGILYIALISIMFNTLGTLRDVSANSNQPILENNTYVISMNKDMSAAFYAPSKDEYSNIKRGGSIGNNNDQARYNLTHLGGNRYKIENVFSGLTWRMKDGSKNDNTPIIQSKYIGDDANQFYIETYRDAYSIRNVNSNKLISPSGQNVVQHSSPKDFRIYIQKAHILDEGRYTLSMKSNGINDAFYAPNAKVGATINRGQAVMDIGDAATWVVSHVSNGRYRIKNESSGLYMAVKDHSTADNVDVIQVDSTFNENALFNIDRDGDGFSIKNVHSGKRIGPSDRKVIQNSSFINSKIFMTQFKNTDHVPTELYTIDLGSEQDYIYSSNDIWGATISRKGNIGKGNSAIWEIKQYDNELYQIINAQSGLCMSVQGDSNDDYAKIIQVKNNPGQMSQLWTIKRVGGTSYKIRNAKSYGLLVGNGNDVIQHRNPKTQTVELMPILPKNFDLVLHTDDFTESGYYPEGLGQGARIKVGGKRHEQGDLIHWEFENVRRNIYRIKNVKTGLYLDVKGESKDEGAPLLQWPKNNKSNQEFGVIAVNGGYNIYNVNSNKFITNDGQTMIQSSIISPNSNIYIYEKEELPFDEGEYMIYVSYFRNKSTNEEIENINNIYTTQNDSEIYNNSDDTTIGTQNTRSYIDEVMTSKALYSGDYVRAVIGPPIETLSNKWILKKEEHGYTIQNRLSRLYLTVEDGLIVQRGKNGELNQIFGFEQSGIFGEVASIKSAMGGYIMYRYDDNDAYAVGEDPIHFTLARKYN